MENDNEKSCQIKAINYLLEDMQENSNFSAICKYVQMLWQHEKSEQTNRLECSDRGG